MSIHIGAEYGEIAEKVLLPGDPLRAEWIAQNFLTDVYRYNTRRNMLGFTGNDPLGRRVSVQGSGMGMPSLGIYVHELFAEYGVRQIVRVGTCGSLQDDIGLGQVIIAMGSCSDSNLNRRRFNGLDYAPIANFKLLRRAWEVAETRGVEVRVGNVIATDNFYPLRREAPPEWRMWAEFGVLAIEMETAELYTKAAEVRGEAVSLLTVSDLLYNFDMQMSAEDRQSACRPMIEIALAL